MADKTKTKDSEENAIRVGLAKFGFLKIFITTNVYHINSTSDKNAFLANVNSRSRSLYAIARPSVCLSVCRLSVVCL